MKATKENAASLVSSYFDIELNQIKDKIQYKIKLHFEAIEMIAKGKAIIDIQSRLSLNNNQKKVLIEYIKDL